jgi:pyruvate ferredoxin oxidoreductase gamma subunit
MTRGVLLPHSDRFFEIRFESIGGLGAHAAGQIIASAAVLRMGLNGTHFSSYGSEKKGSVVRSFIRLANAGRAIRTSAPIDSPDVAVVFHSGLLAHPATLAGMRSDSVLIYSGHPGEVPAGLARLPRTTKIIRVDAQTIAMEEKSRPNAVLIGALTAALPFLDRSILLEELETTFAGKHPEAVAANERAFTRGADEIEVVENIGRADGDLPTLTSNPLWGYRTAPIGGVLPVPGNTAHNDLHASRTGWIPVLDRDKCIDCGMCDMVCPDLCLVWSTHTGDDDQPDVKLDGIDYRYCKGCMRCVETCSTAAMTREAEIPGLADQLRVPLFSDLFPKAGGDHAA